MPCGANLSAKPFDEALLLNIANQIEKFTDLANIIAGDDDGI